jgi:hypothetical protein
MLLGQQDAGPSVVQEAVVFWTSREMILSHKQGAVMILQYTSQYLSRVFCFESK